MDELQKSRFTGYPGTYDRYRPKSPVKTLYEILKLYLAQKIETLVDVGCGTGLSTFPWAKYSEHVIGVEPNIDMISAAQEKALTRAARKVNFVRAEAESIPMGSGSAHLVTCSQSFHWMEPKSTLTEFSRILRPNGIFAVYDCDWPPSIGESLENSFAKILHESKALLKAMGMDAKQWPKSEHLVNIRKSGYFRFYKEISFHTTARTNANAFIGLIESQGVVQQALRLGNNELKKLINEETMKIQRCFGRDSIEMILTYRLRMGIRE